MLVSWSAQHLHWSRLNHLIVLMAGLHFGPEWIVSTTMGSTF